MWSFRLGPLTVVDAVADADAEDDDEAEDDEEDGAWPKLCGSCCSWRNNAGKEVSSFGTTVEAGNAPSNRASLNWERNSAIDGEAAESLMRA